MKKYIIISVLVVLILCAFPFTAFAEGGGISNAGQDYFSRVWEYCVDNKTEILTIVGDGLLVALGVIVKLRNDKKTKDIATNLKIVQKDSSGTLMSQTAVVKAVNEMIGGYQDMQGAYEKNQHDESIRNRIIGAVMIQNTAILQILNRVYINNKNLPQGVKDLVNLDFANCLKALEDDEACAAIVDTVKQLLAAGDNGAEDEGEDNGEDSGSTEV